MSRDWISAMAALLCAASVALAAYASHAALPGQASRAFMGTRAPTAPLGGSLLILGWLVLAVDFWRPLRG